MKRSGPPKRRTRLRSNADVQRAWEDRTRAKLRRNPDHAAAVTAADKRRHAEAAQEASQWAWAKAMVHRRSGGMCEANWPGVCPPGTHRAHHVHHRWLRSQGGPDDPDYLLDVCRTVHTHAHDVDRAGANARRIILPPRSAPLPLVLIDA